MVWGCAIPWETLSSRPAVPAIVMRKRPELFADIRQDKGRGKVTDLEPTG
jgi:hypothetical protein